MPRLPLSTFPGVFLLASSVILLQIAMTRVLAVMMWHHLTYVVISIALLGFGASGSILTARRARGKDVEATDAMTWFAALYGVSILVVLMLLDYVHVDSLQIGSDKWNLVTLLMLLALAAAPYLLGGMALGLALTRFTHAVGRIYFVDLIGSGIGGAASVILLASFGASSTMVAAAGLGLAAAVCFAFGASSSMRTRSGVITAIGLVIGLLFSGAAPSLGLPDWHWEPPFAKGKLLSAFQDDPNVTRIYSSTAQVEVGPSQDAIAIIGGDMGTGAMEIIEARQVGQDGDAPTMLIKDAGDLEKFEFLKNSQTASGLVALQARGGEDPKVLVIGVGGGIDVMVSLLHGARSVTAVEINAAMIEMVTERFADYIGNLFGDDATHADKVELVHGEGRSYVSRSDEKFDLIQMSGVDSLAALSTGAYTLSESYLYTTQAVKTFYEHLEDDGYITYSRRFRSHPEKPRETLRLANIACTALDELGVENAHSHVAVFLGRAWASTMIKRGPFTQPEMDALAAYAKEQGFAGLAFDPLRVAGSAEESGTVALPGLPDSVLDRLIDQDMPEVTDDLRPWLREKIRGAFVVVAGADRTASEATIEEIAAKFPAEDRERARKGIGSIVLTMFSVQTAMRSDLGQSREIFEAAFGGDTAQREAFVAEYEHDITACTDDAPFFFNYYRYSTLFRRLLGLDEDKKGLEFPVGHLVLLASMAQIGVLGLLLIFWPLRRLDKAGQRTESTWRYFAYFAALGMGFMFVEVVLMQKLVIFLGHPTYSISVVLSSLLVFAGIGSLLSGRMRSLTPGTLRALAGAIALALLLLLVFLTYVVPELLGMSFGARVTVTVLAIAPAGLLLGMPFPTGMRIIETNCPQLLPWCWAVNGFLSVFAAMFCIFLAMQIGFTWVLAIGIAIYLIGLSLMPGTRADAASS